MPWETRKCVWLALLWYWLYCCGQEPNPQYLQGMPVLDCHIAGLQSRTWQKMPVRKVAIKSQWLLEFLGSSAGEGSSVVTAVTKKKKRRRRRRRKKKDQWLIRKFYLTHVFTTWSPLETGTEPCIYFLLPSLPQLYSTKPLQFICQEVPQQYFRKRSP